MNRSKFVNLLLFLSNNIHIILIVVVSLFVIFPFVFLTQYNVPGASDDLLHVWFNAFFMQLSGRFFLESWFGKTFPILLFVGLFFAIFSLFQSHQKQTSKNMLYSLVLLAFFLAKTPDIHQFFWFSGSTVYVIPAIFYFRFISLQIKHLNK